MSDSTKAFPNLKIQDSSSLLKINGRFKCEICKKSRKFFCYTCVRPYPNSEVPIIELPIKIDIIKHKLENDGKSTSCHAKMIAPDYVNIYEYPNIPSYEDEEGVFLLFVSPDAIDVRSLFKGIKKLNLKDNYGLSKGLNIGTFLKKDLKEIVSEDVDDENESMEVNQNYTLDNLPIKKAVFIDSTWMQCRSIYKDDRIKSLNTIVIQNRITNFWRHQRNVPNWFLATIEAIHQLLLEVHINAWGIDKNYYDNCLQDLRLISSDWIPSEKIISTLGNDEKLIKPYFGQYDNILYFFSFIYSLIHSLSDPNQSLPINN